MATEMESAEFLMPPVIRNEKGDLRRAGFEFEYAGLSLETSARLVRKVFGGCHIVDSTFEHRITETRYGDFKIETDSSVLKDKRYEEPLRAIGLDVDKLHTVPLEKLLLGVVSTWVPLEIVTPPVTITDLAAMEELRKLLHENKAAGTRASVRYMFGLHINPETPRVEAGLLRDYLRAFLLLYPWLAARIKVDFTRRLGPFINPFPVEYARLVVRDDYPADAGRLIDDYLAHNPSRNRPLDMLPVLACLDRERVMARAQEQHLVKPRPAFHYRMPNCLIDEPDWTIAREWNTWVAVERLANDPEKLARMSADFLQADEKSFRPFVDRWPGVLEGYMAPAAASPA